MILLVTFMPQGIVPSLERLARRAAAPARERAS